MASTADATDLSRFYRNSLERLPAGAYVCDPDGLITWFNDRAVEIRGREPKTLDASEPSATRAVARSAPSTFWWT